MKTICSSNGYVAGTQRSGVGSDQIAPVINLPAPVLRARPVLSWVRACPCC